jgi:hypothetical protein
MYGQVSILEEDEADEKQQHTDDVSRQRLK